MYEKTVTALGMVAATAVFAITVATPVAAEPVRLTGTVAMFATEECPEGWLPADGRLLPIAENTALFSLLDTSYGGDGRLTTGLPDMRGRTPVASGRGDGLSYRQLGERGGVERLHVGSGTLPSHMHELATAAEESGGGAGVVGGAAGDGLAVSTESGGEPQALDIRDPYLAVTFCIATQGLFPRR